MAEETTYSSADKTIVIPKPAARNLNAKSLLAGMTKDVGARWKIVGLFAVGALVATATWMTSSGMPAKKAAVAAESAAIDTTPHGLSSQRDWKAQTAAELTMVKQSLSESSTVQKELLARMEAMRQEMSSLKTGGLGGGQAQVSAPSKIEFNIPPPPEPPKSAIPVSVAPTQPSGGAISFPAPELRPVPEEKRSAARSFIPVDPVVVAAAAAAEKAKVETEMVPNERMGYLPAASFADATLISGVEAFTGGTASSTPQPIVLRIDENAVLPNAAHYQIKGCHVLVSVWGDMSSERVFGRLATLTCVDIHNKLVLSEEVEGVIVDSDGKNGIRGTLQDRQGAKLARSLLAGFAQGMSTALGAAQTTVSSGVLGTTSTLSGGNAVAAASYGGANKATESLAEYYKKQAEATMPIISVDAGRKVSVLFTKSKALKFESTEPYKVKPKSVVKVQGSAA